MHATAVASRMRGAPGDHLPVLEAASHSRASPGSARSRGEALFEQGRVVSGPTYAEFLRAKATVAAVDGFQVDLDEIHPLLKPHQRRSCSGRSRAAAGRSSRRSGSARRSCSSRPCGSRSTRAGGKALIVCPLGVRQEFDARRRDARHGALAPDPHDRGSGGAAGRRDRPDELRAGPRRQARPERVHGRVSLDEAAMLRSFGSKTFQTFLTLFDKVPYRFVATATPSPNRYQGADPLRRVPRHHGHRSGPDAVLQARLDAGEQPDAASRRSTSSGCGSRAGRRGSSRRPICATAAITSTSPVDGCTPAPARSTCCPSSRSSSTSSRRPSGAHDLERDTGRRTCSATPRWPSRPRPGRSARDPGARRAAARDPRPLRGARRSRLIIVYCHLDDEQRAIERALAAARRVVLVDRRIHGARARDERRLAEWKAAQTVALVGKPVHARRRAATSSAARDDVRRRSASSSTTSFQAIHRIQGSGRRAGASAPHLRRDRAGDPEAPCSRSGANTRS